MAYRYTGENLDLYEKCREIFTYKLLNELKELKIMYALKDNRKRAKDKPDVIFHRGNVQYWYFEDCFYKFACDNPKFNKIKVFYELQVIKSIIE